MEEVTGLSLSLFGGRMGQACRAIFAVTERKARLTGGTRARHAALNTKIISRLDYLT